MTSRKSKFQYSLERLVSKNTGLVLTNYLNPDSVIVKNTSGDIFNFLYVELESSNLFIEDMSSQKLEELDRVFKANEKQGIYTGIIQAKTNRINLSDENRLLSYDVELGRLNSKFPNLKIPTKLDEWIITAYLASGSNPTEKILLNEFKRGKIYSSRVRSLFEKPDDVVLKNPGFNGNGFNLRMDYVKISSSKLLNSPVKIIFEKGNFGKPAYLEPSSEISSSKTSSKKKIFLMNLKQQNQKSTEKLYETEPMGLTANNYQLVPYTKELSAKQNAVFQQRQKLNSKKPKYSVSEVPLTKLLAYEQIRNYYRQELKKVLRQETKQLIPTSITTLLKLNQIPDNYNLFEMKNSIKLPTVYDFKDPIAEDDFLEGRLSNTQLIERNKNYLHHLQTKLDPYFHKIISSVKGNTNQ